jgi:hypothetical protein
MTSLEGFGSGGAGQPARRSNDVASCPRVTVIAPVSLADRARSGHASVLVMSVGEQDAEAEQVGAGASVHLAFEHLDAVDVPFHAARTPWQGQPGGDGVLVGAQPGDERGERGLAGGSGRGHPLLEMPAAAVVHQGGEGPHVRGKGGQFRELARMMSRLAWSAGSSSLGLVMIHVATVRGFGGSGAGAVTRAFPRKRAR